MPWWGSKSRWGPLAGRGTEELVALPPPFLGRAGRPAAVPRLCVGRWALWPDCHKALCHHKESVSWDHAQSRVLLEEAHPGSRAVAVRRWPVGCRWPAGLEEGQAVPRDEGLRLSRVDAGVVEPVPCCDPLLLAAWPRGAQVAALRARAACSSVVLGAAVCPSAVQSLLEGRVWRALVPPRHLGLSLVCPGRRHRRASPRQLGVAGLGPCPRSRPPGGEQCVLRFQWEFPPF